MRAGIVVEHNRKTYSVLMTDEQIAKLNEFMLREFTDGVIPLGTELPIEIKHMVTVGGNTAATMDIATAYNVGNER